jgi:hypothetical protein
MNTVVCSDNDTEYEHIVMLTCFAHSQQFFNSFSHSYIFTSNWIIKAVNEANMLNRKQICGKEIILGT